MAHNYREICVGIAIALIVMTLAEIGTERVLFSRRDTIFSMHRKMRVGMPAEDAVAAVEGFARPFTHLHVTSSRITVSVHWGLGRSTVLTVICAEGRVRSSSVHGPSGPADLVGDEPPPIGEGVPGKYRDELFVP